MTIIGIDPGLQGAICVMEDCLFPVLIDTPTYKENRGKKIKNIYDIIKIRDFISFHSKDKQNTIVYLEKQQPMKGQGVTSMFSTGLGYGMYQGLLSGLKIRYELIHSKTWHKTMGFVSKDPKGQAYSIALRLFPTSELCTPRGKVLDGRCDALLIAEYGRRIQSGT